MDAKFARKEAKPGHVLQVCFYANAIAEVTGTVSRWTDFAAKAGVSEPAAEAIGADMARFAPT